MLSLATFKLTAQLALSLTYNLRKKETSSKLSPRISVIVPAYNEDKTIRACVESLLHLNYEDYEVVVVDDGSNDKTFQELSRCKGIMLIHQSNQGKPAALNHGIRESTGDIVLTVDADTILDKDVLRNVAERFGSKQNLGAIAGNVKVKPEKSLINAIQAAEYATGINLIRKGQSVLGCVTVVPGPIAALKREAIEKVGYFSDDTFAEDFDMTLKILKSGYTIEYEEESVAYTDAPKNTIDLMKQRRRWYRGMIQVLDKHRDMYLNPKYGYAGVFGVPNMWLDSISPFLNLALLLVTLLTWMFSNDNYFSIIGILLFLGISLGVGIITLSMEPRREKRNYFALPLLLFYNMFLDGLRVMSLIEETVSIIMDWEKPKR